MNIFVIIVTYNGAPWIESCLASVIKHSFNGQTNVVVVDNASTDTTVQIIKSKFPQVTLIESRENLGFGRGNNVGMRLALERNADFVFLLNQDAWLKANTLEKLAAISRENPEFGVISPVHLDKSGAALDYKFSSYIGAYHTPGFMSDLYTGNRKKLYSTQFINAAGWLITRACLEKVGGFDPLFFHYGEDQEYCQRVHYHGFRVGICPEAQICHARESPPSTKKLTRWAHIRKQKQREYIMTLIRLKSLNHNLFRLVVFETIDIFALGAKHLLTGKVKPWLVQMYVLVDIYANLGNVRRSRRASMGGQRTYLMNTP